MLNLFGLLGGQTLTGDEKMSRECHKCQSSEHIYSYGMGGVWVTCLDCPAVLEYTADPEWAPPEVDPGEWARKRSYVNAPHIEPVTSDWDRQVLNLESEIDKNFISLFKECLLFFLLMIVTWLSMIGLFRFLGG